METGTGKEQEWGTESRAQDHQRNSEYKRVQTARDRSREGDAPS